MFSAFNRPLRDEEQLPVPSHRLVDESIISINDDDIEPEEHVESKPSESKRGKSSDKHQKRQGKDKKSKHKKESKKKSVADGERQSGVGSEDVKVC